VLGLAATEIARLHDDGVVASPVSVPKSKAAPAA
jgi:hypothetical protein